VRGQHSRRLPNWAIGLIAIVVIAIASFLAYTKELPWHHGYEVKAVFSSAQNVRVKSPVRIAGVEVGEVTDVQPLTSDSPEYQAATGSQASPAASGPPGQQAAVVTMEISDEGRPIHEDATFKLRPRLFLEGNMFVDVSPGTPESNEAESDYTFPMSQTSYSVQLDQVLTTLQSDVRSSTSSATRSSSTRAPRASSACTAARRAPTSTRRRSTRPCSGPSRTTSRTSSSIWTSSSRRLIRTSRS
jgi:phospholipid/cholesterol/gamma-HCH transport system substrate-binding protein